MLCLSQTVAKAALGLNIFAFYIMLSLVLCLLTFLGPNHSSIDRTLVSALGTDWGSRRQWCFQNLGVFTCSAANPRPILDHMNLYIEEFKNLRQSIRELHRCSLPWNPEEGAGARLAGSTEGDAGEIRGDTRREGWLHCQLNLYGWCVPLRLVATVDWCPFPCKGVSLS